MNSIQNFEYFEYKHIVLKKKIGAFGAREFSLETLVGGRPGTTIFQNPGGGGGGWGGSHTRTGPGRPPVGTPQILGFTQRGRHHH